MIFLYDSKVLASLKTEQLAYDCIYKVERLTGACWRYKEVNYIIRVPVSLSGDRIDKIRCYTERPTTPRELLTLKIDSRYTDCKHNRDHGDGSGWRPQVVTILGMYPIPK